MLCYSRDSDIIFSVLCPTLCVISEEDLPVKPQKEWVHMDKLEPEKLEWMKDLPAPRKKGTKMVRLLKRLHFLVVWSIYIFTSASCCSLCPDRPCRLVLILLVIWSHPLKTCPPTWVCTTTGRSLRSVGNTLKIKKSIFLNVFSLRLDFKYVCGDSWP